MTSEDFEFLKFVAEHSKSYATKDEFNRRHQIFMSSLAKIRAENSKPQKTFRFNVNQFADWSPSEYKKILNPGLNS